MAKVAIFGPYHIKPGITENNTIPNKFLTNDNLKEAIVWDGCLYVILSVPDSA